MSPDTGTGGRGHRCTWGRGGQDGLVSHMSARSGPGPRGRLEKPPCKELPPRPPPITPQRCRLASALWQAVGCLIETGTQGPLWARPADQTAGRVSERHACGSLSPQPGPPVSASARSPHARGRFWS